MPQPYKTETPLSMNPYAPLIRPELGVKIALITSLWSNIELQMGFLLSAMLGTHAGIGVSMYLSLTGPTSRRSALEAAAEKRLTKEGQEKLQTVYKTISTAQKQRNAVVHGLWTATDDEPDALILCKTAEAVEAHVKSLSMAPDAGALALLAAGYPPKPRYMLYKKQDFEAIERHIATAEKAIQKFTLAMLLKYLSRSPAPGALSWGLQALRAVPKSC